MNVADPRKALEALASEHGLSILRFLRNGAWGHASQVAAALGIHVSTASKHLAAFHEAGFLDRREHPAHRPTFAYRLRSPVIRIELDLAERVDASDGVALAAAFVEALLESLEKIGGSRITDNLLRRILGDGDWRVALGRRFASAADTRAEVLRLVDDARRALADLIGPAAAGQLTRMAVDRAGEGRTDVLAAVGLQEAAP